MSSIVTILPDRQGIQCTVGAQSRLSFRVVNESGRFRKVGAQILVEPGQRTWLAIQGDSERYLSQTGETTFEVAVSVPPGAEPGRHRFQLLVFDSAEPGEWFNESLVVALEVVAQAVSPPPPPPAAQVMRRSWWVTSGVSLAVAIGSSIAMFPIAVMTASEVHIPGRRRIQICMCCLRLPRWRVLSSPESRPGLRIHGGWWRLGRPSLRLARCSA